MNVHAIVTRNLLDLGAVPLEDFLANPYGHPLRLPPSLQAIAGLDTSLSGPNTSDDTLSPAAGAEVQIKSSTTLAAEDDSRSGKRKREGVPVQPVLAVQDIELEEGELMEEKKLSKGQKKKLKRKAKAAKELEAQNLAAAGGLPERSST